MYLFKIASVDTTRLKSDTAQHATILNGYSTLILMTLNQNLNISVRVISIIFSIIQTLSANEKRRSFDRDRGAIIFTAIIADGNRQLYNFIMYFNIFNRFRIKLICFNDFAAFTRVTELDFTELFFFFS